MGALMLVRWRWSVGADFVVGGGVLNLVVNSALTTGICTTGRPLSSTDIRMVGGVTRLTMLTDGPSGIVRSGNCGCLGCGKGGLEVGFSNGMVFNFSSFRSRFRAMFSFLPAK